MSDYTLTLNHRDLPTQVLFHRFHTFDNYADNLAWLLLSGSLYQPDPGFFSHKHREAWQHQIGRAEQTTRIFRTEKDDSATGPIRIRRVTRGKRQISW